jgi:membrane-bound metal-dependent hydrolase YbcI (DUF457 family)
MANAEGHLVAGTVAGVGLALLLSFLGIGPLVLFLGALVCIIASEFPDIDQDKSLPRKVMRGVLPGLVGMLALYLFFSWRYWNSQLWEQALFVALPAAFIISYEKFIPRHRGAIHKFPGLAVLLSVIAIIAFFVHFSWIEGGVLLLFGAVGFGTHVFLDHI